MKEANRRFLRILASATYFIIAGCTLTPNGNEKDTSTRPSLAGVTLQPASATLLDKIERIYGRQIALRSFELNDDVKNTYLQAEASVNEDGTPVITGNARTRSLTEDDLVHELFHLKLKAEGSPTFEYESKEIDLTSPLITIIGNFLRDPIEHRRFFPTMRDMGLDPDREEREFFRRLISGEPVPIIQNLSDSQTRILYYFRANLELVDMTLLSQLTQVYQARGWSGERAFAQTLIDATNKIDPKDPRGYVNATVACFNLMSAGSVQFTVTQWKTVPAGNIQRNIVVIQVARST